MLHTSTGRPCPSCVNTFLYNHGSLTNNGKYLLKFNQAKWRVDKATSDTTAAKRDRTRLVGLGNDVARPDTMIFFSFCDGLFSRDNPLCVKIRL